MEFSNNNKSFFPGMAVEDGAVARLVFDLYEKKEAEKQTV